MTERRPYHATRAELRAIDEGLAEKEPAPAKLVRAALRQFKAKRRRPIPLPARRSPG